MGHPITFTTNGLGATSAAFSCSAVYADNGSEPNPTTFPFGKIVILEKPITVFFELSNCQGKAYIQPPGCVVVGNSLSIRHDRLLFPSPWTLSTPSLHSELFGPTSSSLFDSIPIASRRTGSGGCTASAGTTINDALQVQLSSKTMRISSPWDVEVF